jgi:hypothetical protein
MSACTGIPAFADAVTTPSDKKVAEALMGLARDRGPAKSFCPSEAARALADDWRPLMGQVRRVAADLPLRATQGGKEVDPARARGPIRLSLRRGLAARWGCGPAK